MPWPFSRSKQQRELPEIAEPPRLPIVLCHGLLGFDKMGVPGFGEINYFRNIRDDLTACGCRVHAAKVSGTADVSVRAAELGRQIRDLGGSVHLIGHSMGGLDARYLISRLDGAEYVVSLTTISTPHHGSPFAEWALRQVGERLWGEEILRHLSIESDAFHNLTCAYALEEFNPQTPDHPEVRYFSYAGAKPRARTFIPLRFPHKIIAEEEGENDGLVSVSSARWGEFLGTEEADHLDQINWGPEYDARWLYRSIALKLAEI